MHQENLYYVELLLLHSAGLSGRSKPGRISGPSCGELWAGFPIQDWHVELKRLSASAEKQVTLEAHSP